MTPRVLVVDDDEGVRYTLRGILEDAAMEVVEAVDGADALSKLEHAHFDLVLSDLRMPNLDGLQLLDRVRALDAPPRFILITAHGSERAAVSAMKQGAYDYFKKPFELDELLAVVERAVESVRLTAANLQLAAELSLARSMTFRSPSMRRLALLAARVAEKDVTVLITGESGTGKERLAEALVRNSPRRDGPFIKFNCAAISIELAEAELFGHERGAFTGAHAAREGLFRAANHGTLFLDEVGELDARTQASLLRVLQEGEVRPVGADHPVSVDVRILAATHRDLERRVAEGAFREDLYYRLKVVELSVPPLRERPEDVEALAADFLREFGQRFSSTAWTLTPALRERLLAYLWPGNVRELRNAIESLVVLSPADHLDLSLLPSGSAAPSRGETRASLAERVAAYERGLLLDALHASGGNRTEAARALGIGRATLYEKLERHHVPKEK